MAFNEIDSLNAVMTEDLYITHHKREVYYVAYYWYANKL